MVAQPVDVQDLKYSKPDVSGPLKILHAPTNRQVKNTKAVETAISALKGEGLDIEFTIVETKAFRINRDCVKE